MGCFAVQKIYGKEPESFAAVSRVFEQVLADFPADAVADAMRTWMQRNREFPTPADIVSLVKRGGRPPLSEAMYVQISRKDPQLRTSDDWAYIREFEREQTTGTDYRDDSTHLRAENGRLRKQVAELRGEVERLEAIVRDGAMRGRCGTPIEPSLEDRVRATIAEMRRTGAAEADVAAFAADHGVAV